MDIVMSPRARYIPFVGMEKSKIARFKYCQQVSINPPIGGIGSYVFRANSLFDPDFTGTGHQPLGFDQMMAFYNHFVVLKSSIKAQYMPDSDRTQTEGHEPLTFGIILSDDGLQASSAGNVEHLLEQRSNTSDIKYGGLPLNSKDSMTTKYFNHRNFFTQSPEQSIYRGSHIANPSEGAYFELWGASINGNDPSYHIFLVTIEFYALLTEPHDLVQS